MEHLISYLNEDEFLELLKINPDIKNADEEDIVALISILKSIDLQAEQIRKVIIANPFYLTRTPNDIERLFEIFKSLDVTYLDSILLNCSWLLDKDSFEIEDYIENKINSGLEAEEAIETLLSDVKF